MKYIIILILAFNIYYELSQRDYVYFKLTDYTGKEILSVNKFQPAGKYNELITAEYLGSGLYFFIANINGKLYVNKMVKL